MATAGRAEQLSQRSEALSLLGRGAFKEAEPLLREALLQTREQNNAETYMWMQRLVQSLIGQAKFKGEAEKLVEEVILAFRRFGPEDEDMLDCKYLHVEIISGLRKFPAAEDLARSTLKSLEDNETTRRGADHPVTFKCRGLLAQILKAQGKTREAEALAKQNMEAMKVVTMKAEGMEAAGSRRLSHGERNALQQAKAFSEKALGLQTCNLDTENIEPNKLSKPKHTTTIETHAPDTDDELSRLASKASAVA